jgi:outer membrane protein insertion porin family
VSVAFSHNLVKDVYQDIVPPIFTDEDVPDPYTSEGEYDDAISEGIEIPLNARMDYHTLDISAGVNTTYIHRMRLGKIGMSTGLSTTVTYLWYDPEIYRPYSQTVRDNLYSWDFINTWSNTIYWDSRDIFYNPTQGLYFSQYFGFTGGFLLGAREYIRLRTRAEAFFTLFRIPVSENFDFATILALHSSISFLTPQIGGGFVITPADTLVIDGMTIGRGWPYQAEFKAVWDSSLELRHPLAEQILWWTWFFDVVGAWREINHMRIGDMSIDDYYFSFGFGLRFTIPGFPIRLYLSRNFKTQNGRVEWEDGDIGPFKFVISFVQTGGF